MENYMTEFLQQTWDDNKTNITSVDDYLLTHNFVWISEDEFHRNKTIGNSTISTSSSPVVWDNSLLDEYNQAVGLSSTEEQRLYFDAPYHPYMNTVQGKSPAEMLFERLQGDHYTSSPLTSTMFPTVGNNHLHYDCLSSSSQELVQQNVGTTKNLIIGFENKHHRLESNENPSKCKCIL